MLEIIVLQIGVLILNYQFLTDTRIFMFGLVRFLYPNIPEFVPVFSFPVFDSVFERKCEYENG